MIEPSEIQVGDIVKVQLTDDNLFARVIEHKVDYLLVNYFTPIDKVYKDAQVFSFEETIERVDFETLHEHYTSDWTLDDFGVKSIGDNHYVFQDAVDSEDSNSDLISEESEDSFIVDDDGNGDLPEDHREIDQQWNSWVPQNAMERNFKNKVDELEARYRHMNDKF